MVSIASSGWHLSSEWLLRLRQGARGVLGASPVPGLLRHIRAYAKLP